MVNLGKSFHYLLATREALHSERLEMRPEAAIRALNKGSSKNPDFFGVSAGGVVVTARLHDGDKALAWLQKSVGPPVERKAACQKFPPLGWNGRSGRHARNWP
jgi:hypothetical protein